MLENETILVEDRYSTGADIIELVEHLFSKPQTKASYQERKQYEAIYRKCALQIIVPIQNHKVALEGSREIGFLAELYPEEKDFYLPLLNVQELHSAWYIYQEGIHMPVLGYKIHPFWSTYVPKRREHLELFATWLRTFPATSKTVIDVGTGTGILSLMMQKYGFSKITSTDNNPNSIVSLHRELSRHPEFTNIHPLHTDLIKNTEKADLIVCNPPWIPGLPDEGFDEALYFDPKGDFFSRFFTQAYEHLNPKGSLVILFSNIMTLLRPDIVHPITKELSQTRFRCIEKHQRRVKPQNPQKRTQEKVELWILQKQ